MAFHELPLNVSLMDLTCYMEKDAKNNNIKKMVKQELKGPLKDILGYTEEEVVYFNFCSDAHSSNFDVGLALLFATILST